MHFLQSCQSHLLDWVARVVGFLRRVPSSGSPFKRGRIKVTVTIEQD